MFSEDKFWSEEVLKNGFQLRDVCETFFITSKEIKAVSYIDLRMKQWRTTK